MISIFYLQCFEQYSIPLQLILKQMTRNFFLFLLLSSMMISTLSLQWYETGHTLKLNRSNFNTLISEPSTYKVVKYFTHSCRYCRMLKQVEEELQAQKQWQFTFYDIDCTKNYQFCTEQANPQAFPYVGIYNLKGELQAQIAGFYPLDVMRESFENIQQRQKQALKLRENENKVKKTQISTKTTQKQEQKISPTSSQTKKIQTKYKQMTQSTAKIQPKEKQNTKQQRVEEKFSQKKIQTDESDDWSSISEGIKILLLLGGFWMFNKLIQPYLNRQQESKSRTVEIPIYGKGESAKNSSGSDQDSKLLSDTL